MRYATILFAVLLASCGQAKTSSKNVTSEDASLSAMIPANPGTGGDTVVEHGPMRLSALAERLLVIGRFLPRGPWDLPVCYRRSPPQ